MNHLYRITCYATTVTALTFALGACSGMTKREQSTAIGAAAGAVGGSILTGGSAVGTLGGAAVGGVIGNEVGKKK